MADVFTKRKRSEIMSRIRSKNTDIEKSVFSFLKGEGVRFRKHYKKVPGNPDVSIPSAKRAIFIDGDFWHGWRLARIKAKLPRHYWLNKIMSNIKRDKMNRLALKKSGWRVLRIWEHELKRNREKAFQKILKFFAS